MIKLHYILSGIILYSGILFLSAGCQQEGPLSAEHSDTDRSVNYNSDRALPFPAIVRNDSLPTEVFSLTTVDQGYPQSADCRAKYFDNWGEYHGSACNIPNGSFFEFYHGALTPPSSVPWGDELTITMTVERDNGELIYSFGPSGCTFDPPAKLWIDWADLGSEDATLYYLREDGSREEQLPDQIDYYNKHMCIYINHFSRYAVAYSN